MQNGHIEIELPAADGGTKKGRCAVFNKILDSIALQFSLLADSVRRSSNEDNEPAFNVDGSPMVGMFDAKGNIYGVTSALSSDD